MVRTVKCPSCGAELIAKDGDRTFMFCEYCGTKVDLIDQRIEHHIVDEARIIEAETDRQIKLKHLEMEMEEYEREKQKRERIAKKKAKAKEKERQKDLEYQEANKKLILIMIAPFVIAIILGVILMLLRSLLIAIGAVFHVLVSFL